MNRFPLKDHLQSKNLWTLRVAFIWRMKVLHTMGSHMLRRSGSYYTILMFIIIKKKYSGLKASLEMKNWDTKCASSWHRQIVTKWLYYLKEHCTIGNKYAVCLYLYSKECCYLYIIGSTFVWVLFSSFPWNKSYPLTHNGIGRVPMHRLKCSFQIHQDSPLPAHFDLRCCDILPPSVLTSM